jgi:predicted O-methyltransferase YrrM
VPLTMTDELAEIYRLKPAWIQREIKRNEAIVLTREIDNVGAKNAIEIGVASGFSSAVILSSLRKRDKSAKLYAFDLSKECYFDKTKKTGQAVTEIFGNSKGYSLKTGLTSADIPNQELIVDFAFIDAGHRHPWPTLDLLSLHRFVKKGGLVGLHDVNMPLQLENAYRQNGPRDLIRMWSGTKRIYKKAPNIGFIELGSDSQFVECVFRSLVSDWDCLVDDNALEKYASLTDRFGLATRKRFEKIIEEKRESVHRTQLVRV